MKKVLMLAYNFPPGTGSGVHRPAKFVKYLRRFDWQPHVVTAKVGKSLTGLDKNFQKEIKNRAKVYPVTKGDLLRKIFHFFKLGKVISFFEIPDFYIWWFVPAYFRAFEVIKKEKINLIYTTSYPLTAHLVGYLLKKVTGLPWVADFRDEWTKNPFRVYEHRWHKKPNQWLEKKVLKFADLVISVTPTYTQQFLEINQGKDSEKFITITNGYDSDDFKEKADLSKEQFTITFAGLLYQEISAKFFLRAVSELINEGKIGHDFQFNLVGSDLHGKGLTGLKNIKKDYWKNLGYLSHKEAVRTMRKSSALLLLVSLSRGAGNIPGKTFEYIASGRPILALIPKHGEAAKLVKKNSLAYIASPNNIKEIKKQLLSLYSDFKKGKLNRNFTKKSFRIYSRINLTKKLAANFNYLVQPTLVGLTRVRNQKQLIKEHLDHLARFCQSVYVYDDASNDGTSRIIKNHSVVKGLIRNSHWSYDNPRKVPDAFHLWRKNQQIMEKAQRETAADWFIFLDIDERLDEDLIRDLPKLINQDRYDMYCFDLFDFYITEKDKGLKYKGDLTKIRYYCGIEYRTIPFLFRNQPGIFFPEGSHREPQGYIPGRVAYLNYKVKHFGKAKSIEDYQFKAKFYQKFRPREANHPDKLITPPVKKDRSDFGTPLVTWEKIRANQQKIGPCIYRYRAPEKGKGKIEYYFGLRVKNLLRILGFKI